LGSGSKVIKHFTVVNFVKLECLSLAIFSVLFLCLWARPGGYPKKEELKGESHG